MCVCGRACVCAYVYTCGFIAAIPACLLLPTACCCWWWIGQVMAASCVTEPACPSYSSPTDAVSVSELSSLCLRISLAACDRDEGKVWTHRVRETERQREEGRRDTACERIIETQQREKRRDREREQEEQKINCRYLALQSLFDIQSSIFLHTILTSATAAPHFFAPSLAFAFIRVRHQLGRELARHYRSGAAPGGSLWLARSRSSHWHPSSKVGSLPSFLLCLL